MRLGVTEYLDCAHFLPGHAKCGELHGHTYKVEITVEGPVKGGMVVDFGDLKQALREVLAPYDHRSWNDFLEYPSVENICELLSQKLKNRLSLTFTLRVWEGHGKWAEI
ncbi:MAG: 6-carboxytetrahydropterin synthase [Acidobacteria bacterium]|nr:6-carboxytetrahydropterin synthase [Acidobacteriota bacterium]